MALTTNTNMSSLVAQCALTSSTNKVNQAIERMSTGYKINHAKDNAANCSISSDINTKIGSYEVAEKNVVMGNDLLETAQDTMTLMREQANRLQDLCIQAKNGTYGATSISAIQSEANARIAEVARLYTNCEYNDIDLLDKVSGILKQKGLDTVAENAGLTTYITADEGPNGKFIDDVVEETPDVIVTDPKQLESAISSNSKIGIANAETLAKLAELVNNGTSCSGKTIILTEDIDLSAYSTGTGWTPIGTYSKTFQGTFNGNGHVVSNLYISSTTNYQGLFGYAIGELKNVGIENCNVSGNNNNVGGLVGKANNTITNCYATGNVTGFGSVGGLAGYAANTITNSYATGNVSGRYYYVGGLVGWAGNTITNSYATGNVTGTNQCVGGLAGYGKTITNCYATGNVTGTRQCVGGLAGNGNTITNCYATGNVSGRSYVGGLAGEATKTITNCYATGNVSGNAGYVGGLVGSVNSSDVTNSVSFAQSVVGTSKVGSFVGSSSGTITDCSCMEIDGLDKIGDGGTEEKNKAISLIDFDTTLQVGIYDDDSSQITFSTNLSYGAIKSLQSAVTSGIGTDKALDAITEFIQTINSKATELGAIQNRLESATKSITTSVNNYTSSRSTIKDADIAQESSKYIQQQILQQAATTLLSTANQSPAIALQLI